MLVGGHFVGISTDEAVQISGAIVRIRCISVQVYNIFVGDVLSYKMIPPLKAFDPGLGKCCHIELKLLQELLQMRIFMKTLGKDVNVLNPA